MAVAVGLVFGFLSGLGVGGGTLLIMWLTLVCHMDSGPARQINLLFFLFAASTATLVRFKKGNLHLQAVLPAILAGMLSAAIFSYLSVKIDPQPLKKLFGGLLVVVGLRELFYRPRKDK